MGLSANTPIVDIDVDKVFIGSCTNSRIEDLREAAAIAKGRSVASNIRLALVVPGSGLVKQQAEAEGLDKIFRAAGFEWREPGCSMCLAMKCRPTGSRRTLCFNFESKFRGASGAGWPDTSGQPGNGCSNLRYSAISSISGICKQVTEKRCVVMILHRNGFCSAWSNWRYWRWRLVWCSACMAAILCVAWVRTLSARVMRSSGRPTNETVYAH